MLSHAACNLYVIKFPARGDAPRGKPGNLIGRSGLIATRMSCNRGLAVSQSC